MYFYALSKVWNQRICASWLNICLIKAKSKQDTLYQGKAWKGERIVATVFSNAEGHGSVNKNDFAKRPPMGWNSYDYYDTTVNEEQVKANADFMAKNLKQAGYEYVVIDIEWYAPNAASDRENYQYIPFERNEIDEYGRFQPAPNRFPSSVGPNGEKLGFKPLSDYIHNLGLKFGIHIMRGIPRAAVHEHMPIKGTGYTANQIAYPSPVCPWNPDMYGISATKPGALEYYKSIIDMYAEWGVDFIKCDDICNIKGENPYGSRGEIELLHRAIVESGREIVLSLSPGPALIEEAWHLERNANMWRITDDLWDVWDLLKDMFRRCEIWQKHVGGGNWPDCDMLPFGMLCKGHGCEHKSNLTPDERLTMYTLWCIFRSPLMIGGELTLLDQDELALLQDETLNGLNMYGGQPEQLFNDGKIVIWTNVNTKTKVRYIAVFNISEDEQDFHGVKIRPHACVLTEA